MSGWEKFLWRVLWRAIQMGDRVAAESVAGKIRALRVESGRW